MITGFNGIYLFLFEGSSVQTVLGGVLISYSTRKLDCYIDMQSALMGNISDPS
jgi:hypothetical protein